MTYSSERYRASQAISNSISVKKSRLPRTLITIIMQVGTEASFPRGGSPVHARGQPGKEQRPRPSRAGSSSAALAALISFVPNMLRRELAALKPDEQPQGRELASISLVRFPAAMIVGYCVSLEAFDCSQGA